MILILGAILLAGVALGVGAVMPVRERPSFVYALLILMAGIYVGFAIIGLEPVETANKAQWSGLLIEGAAALAFVFSGHAVLGSRRVWLLGALIMGHGAIDLAHLLTGREISPAGTLSPAPSMTRLSVSARSGCYRRKTRLFRARPFTFLAGVLEPRFNFTTGAALKWTTEITPSPPMKA